MITHRAAENRDRDRLPRVQLDGALVLGQPRHRMVESQLQQVEAHLGSHLLMRRWSSALALMRLDVARPEEEVADVVLRLSADPAQVFLHDGPLIAENQALEDDQPAHVLAVGAHVDADEARGSRRGLGSQEDARPALIPVPPRFLPRPPSCPEPVPAPRPALYPALLHPSFPAHLASLGQVTPGRRKRVEIS